MNNLEKKIIQAIEQENAEELLEVFQTISFKISKGLGTFSNISCPFYVAVLQQYANALMNDMDENGRDFAKVLIEDVSHYTCVKFPSLRDDD